MNRPNHEDLDALISAAIDGELTPASHEQLGRLIAESEMARQRWLDTCRLHVELRLYSRADMMRGMASAVQSDSSSGNSLGGRAIPTADLAAYPAPQTAEKPICRASLRLAAAFIGLAAAFALWFYVDPSPPGNGEPQVVAEQVPAARVSSPRRRPEVAALRRDSFSGAALSGATEPQMLLAGDELSLSEGSAHLDMTSGAKLFVEAPVRLRFVGPEHVRLLRGSLSAELSKWATGFIVDTNAMRLVDLGTTFAVSADSSCAAEAQVISGLVKVHPNHAGRDDLTSFLVSKGESVRIDREGMTRASVDVDSDLMRAKMQELAKLDSYRPIPMHNTGRRLQEGEEDPHWRIVDPDIESGQPRYAVVCRPHPRYSTNQPKVSQWIAIDRNNSPVAANRVYRFCTTFELAGFDLRSVRVIGQVLADNGIKEIRLNGVAVEFEGWVDNSHFQKFGQNEFRIVEIAEGFCDGTNTLEFDVWNGGEYRAGPRFTSQPNPMALRVEWQAFGRPAREG